MLGLILPHGQSFWLPLSGDVTLLVVTNFLMVWPNGLCQLTIATVAAVIIAAIKHPEYSADFVEKHHGSSQPFHLSFLLGWMPAPIEISAINSLWSMGKKKTVDFNTDDALFDFNVGYIGTAILAVFFVALGALIQYPTGKPVEAASAKYIAQFVGMYASVR